MHIYCTYYTHIIQYIYTILYTYILYVLYVYIVSNVISVFRQYYDTTRVLRPSACALDTREHCLLASLWYTGYRSFCRNI